MRQIQTFRDILLYTVAVFVLAASLIALMPTTTYAAGCNANAAGAREEEKQAECISAYIDQCKKDFPNNKSKCESMTVADINKCARDNGNKLKEDCFRDLNTRTGGGGGSSGGSNGLGTGAGGGPDENDCKAASYADLNKDNCGIINLIIVITNVLSGLAAVIIVAVVIWGGVQYSMAGADPSKVQAAKQRIINGVIALVLLVFGYAIVQWLVPGGLF